MSEQRKCTTEDGFTSFLCSGAVWDWWMLGMIAGLGGTWDGLGVTRSDISQKDSVKQKLWILKLSHWNPTGEGAG